MVGIVALIHRETAVVGLARCTSFGTGRAEMAPGAEAADAGASKHLESNRRHTAFEAPGSAVLGCSRSLPNQVDCLPQGSSTQW